jgi:hypothetical protein
MFNIMSEADDEKPRHKDLGPKQMERDQEDVTKLVQEFTRFNVFSRDSSDLVSITK